MDADYTETFTRRCIWYLPSPAPFGEVYKAAVVARRTYKEITGREAMDDVPMIESHDEQVHIYFDVEVKERS